MLCLLGGVDNVCSESCGKVPPECQQKEMLDNLLHNVSELIVKFCTRRCIVL